MPRRFRRYAQRPETQKRSALEMVIRAALVMVVCAVAFKVFSCQSRAWYDAESKKLKERSDARARRGGGSSARP